MALADDDYMAQGGAYVCKYHAQWKRLITMRLRAITRPSEEEHNDRPGETNARPTKTVGSFIMLTSLRNTAKILLVSSFHYHVMAAGSRPFQLRFRKPAGKPEIPLDKEA